MAGGAYVVVGGNRVKGGSTAGGICGCAVAGYGQATDRSKAAALDVGFAQFDAVVFIAPEEEGQYEKNRHEYGCYCHEGFCIAGDLYVCCHDDSDESVLIVYGFRLLNFGRFNTGIITNTRMACKAWQRFFSRSGTLVRFCYVGRR